MWRRGDENWKDILRRRCNWILQNGLGDSEGGGVALIYKNKGDKERIMNWRPIQLLCTDRKLLMLILGERLKKKLPEWIREQQRGFVPSRRIEEAVMWPMIVVEGC